MRSYNIVEKLTRLMFGVGERPSHGLSTVTLTFIIWQGHPLGYPACPHVTYATTACHIDCSGLVAYVPSQTLLKLLFTWLPLVHLLECT